MKPSRSTLIFAGLALVGLPALAAMAPHSAKVASTLSRQDAPIVFVCRNGVAMSVWSALVFDRLAEERGLDLRSASRGSAPEFPEMPLSMRLALALDGFRVGRYEPELLTAADVDSARYVVLIDTELPASLRADDGRLIRWGGFPPMREKYFESRAALEPLVEKLVEELAVQRPGT